MVAQRHWRRRQGDRRLEKLCVETKLHLYQALVDVIPDLQTGEFRRTPNMYCHDGKPRTLEALKGG